MSKRVLVVDDDATLRTSLVEALKEAEYEVSAAGGGAEALALLDRAAPEVVVSDVRMEDIDGLTLLRTLRSRAPEIDVVLMTAFDDMATVVTAMRDGAVEFLSKPLDLHELRVVLARVFEDRRARTRAKRDLDGGMDLSVDGLVGRTPQMIGVYKLIGQTAGTRATVLIRGESGTGKEVVARAIQANSPFADEPFVAVN
jgi:DNA-binding NtrC family response regulator